MQGHNIRPDRKPTKEQIPSEQSMDIVKATPHARHKKWHDEPARSRADIQLLPERE